jgi:hypothetical protein
MSGLGLWMAGHWHLMKKYVIEGEGKREMRRKVRGRGKEKMSGLGLWMAGHWHLMKKYAIEGEGKRKMRRKVRGRGKEKKREQKKKGEEVK